MNILNNIFTILFGLIASIVFFLMELFIIPGFGIMGMLGITILAITTRLAYKNLGPEAGIYTLLAGIFLASLFVYYFIKRQLFKKTTLQYRLTKEDGYGIRNLLIKEYIDKEGIAISVLRPVGIIEIDGERLDATAEGTFFLEKGSKIKVVGIEGNRLRVQKTEEV
ncbi:MAG: NfeD family protein [Candidatus Kaelpia aquatica]|nr:NfeD family protein [Candidatus Kaelpia aquatica]